MTTAEFCQYLTRTGGSAAAGAAGGAGVGHAQPRAANARQAERGPQLGRAVRVPSAALIEFSSRMRLQPLRAGRSCAQAATAADGLAAVSLAAAVAMLLEISSAISSFARGFLEFFCRCTVDVQWIAAVRVCRCQCILHQSQGCLRDLQFV